MLQQCYDGCFPNHQAHHPFIPLSAIHNLGICCYLASCCSCTVSYWGEICYKFQLNLLPASSMWHCSWVVILLSVCDTAWTQTIHNNNRHKKLIPQYVKSTSYLSKSGCGWVKGKFRFTCCTFPAYLSDVTNQIKKIPTVTFSFVAPLNLLFNLWS
jgi:hypothetical protein